MNQDARVMKYFEHIWTAKETKEFINRMQLAFKKYGYCYFAIDLLKDQSFIGFTGLFYQDYKSSFNPAVDMGWRLKPAFWAKGYAKEAAKACIIWAFEHLKIKELYAVTPLKNVASQALMKKLGMRKYRPFIHPKISATSELKNCIAYRILNNQL